MKQRLLSRENVDNDTKNEVGDTLGSDADVEVVGDPSPKTQKLCQLRRPICS